MTHRGHLDRGGWLGDPPLGAGYWRNDVAEERGDAEARG